MFISLLIGSLFLSNKANKNGRHFFVHIFVQNLREVIKSKHPKLADDKDQLRWLYNQVYPLSIFLKKNTEDQKVNNSLVMDIRKVMRRAENMVDTLVSDTIGVPISPPPLSLDLKWLLLQELDFLKIGVNEQTEKEKTKTKTTDSTRSEGGEKNKMNEDDAGAAAVGIDEEMEKILDRLDGGEKQMEVISVVGSPGIGKTTLAQKVFDHCRTRNSFQIRAWITVSQNYSIRRLLMDILKSSGLFQDVDEASTEDKLGEDLLKCLKDTKYLIVLDDIWSTKAWNSIQKSFQNQHNGSRVLLTSRSSTGGKDLSSDVNTHSMSGLSKEGSWSLLQRKVFGDQRRCPPYLEKLGKNIAEKCDGLPLAIVVVGGLLAKKGKTPEVWWQVARDLRSALATDREAYMGTLALSYQDLPLHLKVCFLYIGAFPKDYDIPARSLVWLLVAEGLVIQDQNGNVEEKDCLEATMEGCLNELVERSLLTVGSKRSCGAIKTFRIHDLLRNFCLVKGKQENFIAQLTNKDIKSPSFETICTGHHCLYVEDQALDHILQMPWGLNLRLLVLTNEVNTSEVHIPLYVPYVISKRYNIYSFKLLRVLDLLKCPIGIASIEYLVHLKYLGVSFANEVWILPTSMTKLFKLETLFLRARGTTYTPDGNFYMPDGIWCMVKLRHVFNEGGGVLHFVEVRRNPVLGNLQTLHPPCACKSCLQFLVRTPNLRKLGLSGNPSYGGSVIDLSFLNKLESLSFKKVWLCGHPTLGKHNLPASLRKLTLESTPFTWDDISLLGELKNLEVLQLLDYMKEKPVWVERYRNRGGSVWDTSEEEFPQLKYLKMRNLDIRKWKDYNLQFESLEELVLEECYQLESIPFDLALSPSLHTLEVTRCSTSLEILAKKIEKHHQNQSGDCNLQVFITSHY